MRIALTLCSLLVAGSLFAQVKDSSQVELQEKTSELKGQVEGMNEMLLDMKSTVDALKKIKITGYIQSQYQTAESDGIGTFSGGSFPSSVHSRFLLRRGRVKVNYDNDLTQYVLQIDVTQNGVGIKDAYATIKEPWLKSFSLTGGIFDRPFGFEISYSSSSRESPERTRLFQTLFPGERELGAKIEITPPETSPLSFLNVRAGLLNGVLNTANENDNFKDLIGRVGVQVPLAEQGLAIDGGLSFYSGQARSNSRFVYKTNGPAKNFTVDSTAANVGSYHDRSYLGADVQLYYDLPGLGGLSLRGEFISGKQPGTATSGVFYNPGSTITPLYQRNFTGWYINYVQNIGLEHQLVVKYDELDPNTDVEGNDIGAPGKNLAVADVRYTTFGIGWIYHWDANVKFTFYYDIVANEKVNPATNLASLIPFKEDIKDNVFTVRMQYKF
ncbi:MAG: hypothetical protein AABZ02_11230 [Bacteroidota bacterium]